MFLSVFKIPMTYTRHADCSLPDANFLIHLPSFLPRCLKPWSEPWPCAGYTYNPSTKKYNNTSISLCMTIIFIHRGRLLSASQKKKDTKIPYIEPYRPETIDRSIYRSSSWHCSGPGTASCTVRCGCRSAGVWGTSSDRAWRSCTGRSESSLPGRESSRREWSSWPEGRLHRRGQYRVG